MNLSARIPAGLAACSRLALAALLVSFYTLPHTPWSAALGLDRFDALLYGAIRPRDGALLVVVAAATLMAYLPLVRRAPHRAPLLALLGLWVVIYGLAIASSRRDHVVVANCSIVLASLSFGMMAARLCGRQDWVLAILAAAGAMAGAYAVQEYATGSSVLVSGDVRRAGGLFGAPLELSYVMLLCLPAALYWAMRGATPLAMVAATIAAAAIAASLCLTLCRMSIIAAAASLCYIVFRQVRPRGLAALACAAAAIVCLSMLTFRMAGPVNAASAAGSLRGHEQAWRGAAEIFLSHPLTGYGVGRGDCMDLLLQWLAELGIGGGVFLAAFYVAGRRALGHLPPLQRDCIAASLVAISIAGVADVPFALFSRTGPTCLLGSLLGALLLPSRRAGPATPPSDPAERAPSLDRGQTEDRDRRDTQTGKRTQLAFTLVELLVVVGIIALLAAIIFPVLSSARESGRIAVCISNERQIGMAILAYSGDYDDRCVLYFDGCGVNPNANFAAPGVDCTAAPDGSQYWPALIGPYVGGRASGQYPGLSPVFVCPDAPDDATAIAVQLADLGLSQGRFNMTSYGLSDNWVDWRCPADCAAGTGIAHSLDEAASPSDCILVAETYFSDQIPGFSLADGADDAGSDYDNCGSHPADELAGLSLRHRGPVKSDSCQLPPSGALANTLFADGHVKSEPAAFLADHANWSILAGAGERYEGVRCCDCATTPGKCWWP